MSLGINTKPTSEQLSKARTEKSGAPIDRPIFITGMGRSGTTILHTMLSAHPQANWMSLFCAKFPDRPYLNRWLMRGIDIPILNLYLKRRFVPLENYAFWDSHFAGFSKPCRDLFGSDVSVRTRKLFRKTFSQFPTRKRNRVLVKITGFPRIGFLHAIFPDAKFVEVIRDGRAVVNSRLNTGPGFWKGWQGLNHWNGKMPEHYEAEWERHKHSFVALAGIEWKAHLDQMESLRRDFPEIDIYKIRYESFCESPTEELRKLAEHCELSWTSEFESALAGFHVGSENEKWKTDLTEEQKAILQDVLRPYLIKYGYEVRQAEASVGRGSARAELV